MRLEEVIWPNKFLLRTIGFWPMHPHTGLARQLFIYLRIAITIFSSICLFLPHFMTVVVYWGDIAILGDYGALALFYLLLMSKMLYYVAHHRSYSYMYQCIKDFWDISDDVEERKSYEEFASIAKLVTVGSFLIGICNFISFESVVLMSWIKNRHETNESLRHRPLPLEFPYRVYGFDTQPSPTYEIILIWQSLCLMNSIFAIIGGDCTMVLLILHVTGQFRLINTRFRAIGSKIGDQTVLRKDELHDEMSMQIGRCVTQHQHTIRVAKELDSLLSPIIFGQIMTSGLEICLSGYAVIEGEGSGAKLIKFLVFFVSMLVQIFIWCWPGELLIRESNVIADTIYYDMPWFKLSPGQQRDLKIIIVRAQKECHVTALYQVMSIRKLTEVFNAAGSYMALLQSMKK